jgi:hypothetical protein
MAGFDPAVLFRRVLWMPVVGDGDQKYKRLWSWHITFS